MAGEEARERFMAAEQEATQIAETLTQLKQEIQRYKSQRDALVDLLDATSASTTALQPIAGRIAELVASLERLGFTEFRDDVSEVRGTVGALAEDTPKRFAAVDQAIAEEKADAEKRYQAHLSELRTLRIGLIVVGTVVVLDLVLGLLFR